MSDEFERALQRALRPQGPARDLCGPIVVRLDADAPAEVSVDAPADPPAAMPADVPAPAPVVRATLLRRRVVRTRWLPAALAACLVAGIAIVQMRQHALDVARANHARAQLLQALSIASSNVNIVRAAVAREENPDT
ncbi:MAG TPA: hypothetical protein VFX20_02325 [Steroidobacteraceae bacterium]|nr:hypothetical protein [Steroidobacteraceae bacterium]